MKKITTLLCVAFSLCALVAKTQNVGIGITNPNPSAMLEVASNTKGMLVPRMSALSRIALPIPANGLLVYDIDSTCFAYHTGGIWYFLKGTTNIANNWNTTGNAGTTATSFIGTTDTQPIRFKVNAQPAGIIDSIQANTAIGYGSLKGNTTGNFNAAYGFQSLPKNTTGSFNTASGYLSLQNNEQGNYNTANGSYALKLNNTGSRNTASGFAALAFNNGGFSNSAFGYEALKVNYNGFENSAFGINSLYSNYSGIWNTAIGADALYYNFSANYNTAVGRSALYENIDGEKNTALGSSAGGLGGVTNLLNTVTLGYESITNTNGLAILGNTLTTYCGGYKNWSNYSDGRFKTNVKENVVGLDFVKKLRPVTYTVDVHNLNKFIYKDKTTEYEKGLEDLVAQKNAIIETGFIAQEVEAAAKKVGYNFDGVNVPKDKTQNHYSISYASFVVPLVKAVQEQQEIIEAQNKKIAALEAAAKAKEIHIENELKAIKIKLGMQ